MGAIFGLPSAAAAAAVGLPKLSGRTSVWSQKYDPAGFPNRSLMFGLTGTLQLQTQPKSGAGMCRTPWTIGQILFGAYAPVRQLAPAGACNWAGPFSLFFVETQSKKC